MRTIHAVNVDLQSYSPTKKFVQAEVAVVETALE